jgi:ketosteroid isomerase-like protein
MAADRAFARAVLDSGFDAWERRLAPDAAKPGGKGEVILRGREPVAAWDKSNLFADAARQLRWEPTDAVGFTDGRTGMTVGRAVVVRRGTADTVYRGHYVTVWQRQSDGRWLIILDTGSPDQ